MAGARVRRLRNGDIDRAIALTDLEEWGYTREDFRRLRGLSPKGCFVAEQDGKVIGVLTTTTYGPLAFLGAVVVEPRERGKGIGEQMMRAALDYLDESGVDTVRLNAYLDVAGFYAALGFRKEFENIRWQGPRVEAETSVARPSRPRDFQYLLEIDDLYFGGSRRTLLFRLAREFSKTFLVVEGDERVLGFIVGNTTSPAIEIGPWVVEAGRYDVARELFHGLMVASSGTTYAFTAPRPNRSVHEFAKNLGYHEVFRTVRMVRGRARHKGTPDGIWGFAGLEKG